MLLHEFQAKGLLAEYGLPIARGAVAMTAEEAEAVARDIGSDRIVVKAQIHAGERFEAGGVRMVHGPSMARSAAADMIGRRLVTPQTDEEGETVRRVYVEQGGRDGPRAPPRSAGRSVGGRTGGGRAVPAAATASRSGRAVANSCRTRWRCRSRSLADRDGGLGLPRPDRPRRRRERSGLRHRRGLAPRFRRRSTPA